MRLDLIRRSLLGLMFTSCLAFASDFRPKVNVVNVAAGSGDLVIVGSDLTEAELQHTSDAVLADVSGLEPKLTFAQDGSKTEHPSKNSVAWHFRVTTTAVAPQGPE